MTASSGNHWPTVFCHHAAALLCTALVLLCALPATAQEDKPRKFTPREAAELRYADKLVQRGYQYMAGGRWKLARKDFREAIKSTTIVYGDNTARNAELYVLIGRTYYTQATAETRRDPGPMTTAREAYAKAIEIYESLPPPQNEALLDTYMHYGDLLQVASSHEAAREQYLNGWDLLVEKTSERAANDYFRQALNLLDLRPRKGYRSSDDQIVWFTFEISADGRIRDIEDKGSKAGRKLMNDMRTILDRARFRPRIVAREPSAMRGYLKLRFPSDGSRPQDLPDGA
ncbi:MAG: tetratricopeptide repeat protein [Pseudomonadota bacterium]